MRPVLIAGAGMLGHAFARLCAERGLAHVLTRRSTLDLAAPGAAARALREARPWLVINAAGYSAVDRAEHDPARCYRDNVRGAALLAAACARHGTPLVTFSSDRVFDGRSAVPYVESDPLAPLCVFGRTKQLAERRVLAAYPAALVIRTGACFGPWDERNFLTAALRALEGGDHVSAARDATMSLSYIPDVVHACLDLALDGERGHWHLAHADAVTHIEALQRAAPGARARIRALESAPPSNRALASARGALLPALDDAFARYHHARSHA